MSKIFKESNLQRKLHNESVIRYIRTDSAITLITLIVTIIVLLILAGVSLSLVAGGDGILERAENAVEKHNEAQIKEEVELAMAELKTQYYEDRYVKKTTTLTYPEYAKEKLTSKDQNGKLEGIETSNGKVILDETIIKYIPEGETEPTATGTFDEATGEVTIAGVKTEGSGTEETPQVTKYTLSYDANGGTMEIETVTQNDNKIFEISNIIPTKEGYAFEGWNTKQDGTGTTYNVGESITVDNNLTLYAQWSISETIEKDGIVFRMYAENYTSILGDTGALYVSDDVISCNYSSRADVLDATIATEGYQIVDGAAVSGSGGEYFNLKLDEYESGIMANYKITNKDGSPVNNLLAPTYLGYWTSTEYSDAVGIYWINYEGVTCKDAARRTDVGVRPAFIKMAE